LALVEQVTALLKRYSPPRSAGDTTVGSGLLTLLRLLMIDWREYSCRFWAGPLVIINWQHSPFALVSCISLA